MVDPGCYPTPNTGAAMGMNNNMFQLYILLFWIWHLGWSGNDPMGPNALFVLLVNLFSTENAVDGIAEGNELMEGEGLF